MVRTPNAKKDSPELARWHLDFDQWNKVNCSACRKLSCAQIPRVFICAMHKLSDFFLHLTEIRSRFPPNPDPRSEELLPDAGPLSPGDRTCRMNQGPRIPGGIPHMKSPAQCIPKASGAEPGPGGRFSVSTQD